MQPDNRCARLRASTQDVQSVRSIDSAMVEVNNGDGVVNVLYAVKHGCRMMLMTKVTRKSVAAPPKDR